MSLDITPRITSQTSLIDESLRLLDTIGRGHMDSTVYDTAWLARIGDQDPASAAGALAWLRERQLPDGSWGAAQPLYFHDRVLCTLSALIALGEHGDRRDAPRIARGLEALELHFRHLELDPAKETVAFEMLLPTLLREATALGLTRPRQSGMLGKMSRARDAKLARVQHGLISRQLTMAFSAEMAGRDARRILDMDNLQEANGSVGYSPAATVYYLLNVAPGQSDALTYIRLVLSEQGLPNVAPFDVFERAWSLWNLAQTELLWLPEFRAASRRHLEFLAEAWAPGEGVGFAAGYTPKDGDDSGLVHDVLNSFEFASDLQALLSYEKETHFRCFWLETNPSVSANIHMLSALRRAGMSVTEPSIQKVLQYLAQSRTARGFWVDKWHASPYYATGHAIIAGAGYGNGMISAAVDWILDSQDVNGSWGYYGATAEETAYTLQALVAWRRNGGVVADHVLRCGAQWLERHRHDPSPPLWIGKCLYSPAYVVQSAILSALLLVEEELG